MQERNRRTAKKIAVGRLYVGGNAPVSVQSMANTDPHDFAAALRQAIALQEAGCDILRFTVPDAEAAPIFGYLKEHGITMPLVADIHFDYRAALAAADAGADKIRINPGNIGSDDRVKAVVQACRTHRIPIRIGVNSGSLEKQILAKHGGPTAQALAESALYHASLLERFDFDQIILSIKSSDPAVMMEANRLLAARCPYPLHLGVTEAGSAKIGSLRNAIGIGGMLCEGIGDTLRVSLTADPLREVEEGKAILRAAGVRQNGLNVISCPTCGRTKIDLISLVEAFEARAEKELQLTHPITVAIMGCVVNGPGEAKEADVGIAGGVGEGLLFRHGVPISKIPEAAILDTLLEEIRQIDLGKGEKA